MFIVPPRLPSNHVPAMAEIEYESVSRYWQSATPSILGPYMMNGFGFPIGAGNYRFRAKCRIVKRLLCDVDRHGTVLDLGSGAGYWAEEFAHRFSKVITIEGSRRLYRVLQKRCAPYTSVKSIHSDVLSFKPRGRYRLIFLGGLLMYLDQKDVITMLQRLIPRIDKGGVILCRESTVRGKAVTHQGGNYPVIYRSVQEYRDIFSRCGLTVRHVERNEPYVLMQIGRELVKKWTRQIPEPFRVLSVVGRIIYCGLRLGSPWINTIPKALGASFPILENHFFVLGTNSSDSV